MDLIDYWIFAGPAILLFGIPAILANLCSHLLEGPIIRFLRMKQQPGSGETINSRENNWFLRQYGRYSRLYDGTVNFLKITSYILTLLFGYSILGTVGIAGFSVLIIPSLWSLIKKNSISRRVDADIAEEDEVLNRI